MPVLVVSSASMVKIFVPADEGVPEITPEEALSERPEGREPVTTKKFKLPCEEVVLMVAEYAVPAVPLASEPVVIIIKENWRMRLLLLSATKSRLVVESRPADAGEKNPLCVGVVAATDDVKSVCPRTFNAFSPFAIVEVAASKTMTRLLP